MTVPDADSPNSPDSPDSPGSLTSPGSPRPGADGAHPSSDYHAAPPFAFTVVFRGYAPDAVAELLELATAALRTTGAGGAAATGEAAAELRERHARLPRVLRGFRPREVDAAVERMCAELARGPSAAG
ncbi:hypothetical protein ACFPZ0_09650 [Streptomonospora nanhaiensis]|uniref:hypothetical protein n=1 Tax=Streptomonospora nanhaiensis TaxID=1323731 RepID=UPI001C99F084|nr:hypothetical protein [Streptomonospora nanhaiensis]MBX9391711.1 hypothetical protein [Streptomonospora nanhaiensis]